MRPRERDQDTPPPELSPSPLTPPPRPAPNLSSMVVRPSDPTTTAATTVTAVDFDSPTPGSYHRDSPPFHCQRGGADSPPFRRRRDSPGGGGGYARRDSPPLYRQRGGGGSPPVFHQARSQRFRGSPGYLPRAGSISPNPRRPRMDDGHYDPDFDRPVGAPRTGRGFQGGRGGGRFRDTSPQNGFGRGSRSFVRGYDVDRRELSPYDGEYVHRNDPNLSPREGDWICGNPRCGNLNFARRTHCNNCDQPRSAPGRPGPIRSPRRGGYFASPPRGSPPGTAIAPPTERIVRRNFNGYRSSPPRGWAAEGPRDFPTGSPSRRHRGGRGRGGRFQQDHMRRNRDRERDYDDEDYSGRGKFGYLPIDEEWDTRRDDDGFISERRRVYGYERRPPSPPLRERWVRERSRSPLPMGGRPLKGSYMGRGRDDRRHYDDDVSYINRGRTNDSSGLGGRGRGFQRPADDSSFISRGRGDRRGMAPARNNNGDLY